MKRRVQVGGMDVPQTSNGWLRAVLLLIIIAIARPAAAEDWETPQTRLRPIGSPSAVDAFRHPAAPAQARQVPQRSSGPTSAVRQAVMMQAAPDAFSMPAPSLPQAGSPSAPPPALPAPLSSVPGLGPIAPPPASDSGPLPRPEMPLPASPTPLPQSTGQASPLPGRAVSPPGMAPVPRSAAPGQQPTLAGDDYAPLAQPQLESTFATLGNCRNVSAPSGYRSDRILTCGPPVSYVTTVGASAPPPVYLPPPAQLGPPATLPPWGAPPDGMPVATLPAVIPGPAGHRPLISFGQERYPVQVGQGVFGQPTAYVPGQTFRNAIRYFTW